jgi:hypothetical protein
LQNRLLSQAKSWRAINCFQILHGRLKTEALPGSLVTVTSPPIMRASLRERARPLLGELSRGADNLIDKPGQINRLGIEFEFAGFDLRGAAGPPPPPPSPRRAIMRYGRECDCFISRP